MPRIFAIDPAYNANMGETDFVNGAAECAATETEAIAFFTAAGFTIDTNKHVLTPFDILPITIIKDICDWLGITYLAGDSKAQVIRKLEIGISAVQLGTLTVASTDGASSGKSDIAVTEALGAVTNKHYYKIHASVAPVIYYGDYVDSTWTEFDSGDDITATTGHKIAVVETDADGFVLKRGTDTVDSNDN